ncbi:T9SS type A sorting domain-containing protein [Microvirga sp. STR05]|uniref:T9SS type A sorting domain-containing protein n=1 Tax=Hymenobacter duratus TaxID=2771356 RepID=A0ABR8JGI1_9BACT|nr:T9SS type A sorting domain-containing protein [Hymenobacter duratus]MBD2715965.1 T9SS type A sorting domain-containing protein [Hymenobacter duratus]MBR7950879.1 T9SS type A sorting domain-containing protein [Microvirga sp. STR05]
MSHTLPLTGKPAGRVSQAGLRGLRPLMAAALGLLSITGSYAQHRALALPTAAEKAIRPATSAPAAVLPVRTAVAVAQRGQAAISSTATGGNWSDATTWVGGVVPTSADDVTVASGATVMLDVAGSCASLTVEATASLLTSATAAYSLQVAGNVTNNGTLDLSNSATLGSDLRFTGAGNASFTGTGTTDLQTMSLAKAVRADIVEMNLPTLSVKGTAGGNDGFLFTRTTGTTPADDMTGTLKISGTATISNRVFGNAASYIIPATGGFWLNNANFTVTPQTGSPSVAGLLRISAGTYNVGVTIGNSISFATGAAFTMEGGTLNSAGRVTSFTSATAAAAITFNMSGGTINASTVGNTSGTPSFGINGTTTISGGTINLVQRSTATTPLDYYVAGTYNFTGGMVNVGTAATATNFDFRIRGTVPNLTIDNTTNPKSAVLQGQTNAYGTVLVTPGAGLNLNGFLLLQLGSTITNNGTLTGTTTGSTLYFAGAVPQTLGGSGTFTTIRTISVDNSGGGATLTVPIVTTRVNMFTGNLNGTSNLTIGDASAIFFVVQIGVASNTNTSGSFASAPTFNIGSGALQLIYAPEATARTTGFEVPATRIVDVVSISNPAGVTLAGGNLLVPGVSNASLLLTAGILTTSAANTVIIGPAAGAFPTGLATSYVKGPLGITVNSATAVSRTFAVGDAAGWRPVVVTGITAATDQIFTATVVNGATGGTGISPVTNLNPTRYVRLENSANLPATARVQLSYGADDVLGNAATATVAQAATANGTYASIGGAAATVPTTGIVSTLDLTPGNDFFVLANTEGGVLTSSVASVCGGTNSGTLTLASNIGTITGYEANTGSGFTAVPGTNTGSTLAFSNLTTTTTFRAVILTADNRTVYSAPVTVTVEAAPTATLTAATPTTFCGPGTLTLNVTPVTGATYQFLLDGAPISGATSATYTTTVSASGSYSVVVTSATNCTSTSAAVAVTVNPATTATFSYANTTLCAGGSAVTPTITGTTGGTFSSTTGLSIDATTGAIAPATSTPGTYTVTYSVAGTCPSSATATITITTAPVATFSYAAATYCASGTATAAPVFGTGASAGTFSSTTGLTINATTGVITPGTSTPGTYTVTNTIAAAGSCAAATATATVTISAATTATFTYANATLCAGGTTATPTITGTAGGAFSSTTGLTLNATTGAINLSTSTAGTYTVTYSVAGTCPSSATASVTITARPAQPTVAPAYNGTTTTLTSSSATGNQWYLNGTLIPGATSQTYVVNSAAQFGQYTVVVTNATTGCASLPSAQLLVNSSVKVLAGSSLSVYPNPTTDGNVTVELSGYTKATELNVYNAVGQQVYHTTAAGKNGVQTATLDLRQLPAGIYILRARTEGGLDVRRITKQ